MQIDTWIKQEKDYTEEIVELDEYKITKISPALKEELEKFTDLKKLSMIACDLRSLDNFPNLISLEIIELADNKIKGDELSKLPNLDNLKVLTLSSNLINSAQDLKSLVRFNKNIQELNLDECPLTKNDAYRKQVFQLIGGSLEVVDLEDKDGKQVAQQSFESEQEQDQEDGDDEMISDDEEDEGNQRNSKKGAGKNQQNDDDDDEDDDQQLDEDQQLGSEQQQQSESEGPKKKAKRL